MKRRPSLETRLQKLLAQRSSSSIWIGARRNLPHKSCDVCVWHDTRNGEVRLAAYVPANSPPEALATLLGEAMLSPRCGRPAAPRRVIVLSPSDMPPIEALGKLLDIDVTGLGDAALERRMLENLASLLDGPDPGYLDRPAVDIPLLEAFYRATRELWFDAPWTRHSSDEKLSLAGPGVGCVELTIVGNAEDTRGLLVQNAERTLLLRYCSADDIGATLVNEATAHRFKVLDEWPLLTRPLERDVLADGEDLELVTACIEILLHGLESEIPCDVTVDGLPARLLWSADAA